MEFAAKLPVYSVIVIVLEAGLEWKTVILAVLI